MLIVRAVYLNQQEREALRAVLPFIGIHPDAEVERLAKVADGTSLKVRPIRRLIHRLAEMWEPHTHDTFVAASGVLMDLYLAVAEQTKPEWWTAQGVPLQAAEPIIEARRQQTGFVATAIAITKTGMANTDPMPATFESYYSDRDIPGGYLTANALVPAPVRTRQ